MKTAVMCSKRERGKLLIRSKFVEQIRLRDQLEAILKPRARNIGIERERKVREVLEELKEAGEIIECIKTEKFSAADVLDGVDFYIISLKNKKRVVTAIDVCGYDSVDRKAAKHADVVPFPVAINESRETLIMKVLRLVQ